MRYQILGREFMVFWNGAMVVQGRGEGIRGVRSGVLGTVGDAMLCGAQHCMPWPMGWKGRFGWVGVTDLTQVRNLLIVY